MTLDAFSEWMVIRNLEYARIDGVENVVKRLRLNGYHEVAEAVERAYAKVGQHGAD